MKTAATSARLARLDGQRLRSTLELARLGHTAVEPDPYVGAIVCDPTGAIVGRGHHAAYGGPHAEPVALAQAGSRARGATLFCNLEPCGYEAPAKRQPACTRAIIAAGVQRVVIGQIDPHPRVRGRGIERLREAGLAVALAPDPRPFWRANPIFTTTMTLGRPLLHVVTAAATSGATAPAPGPWHDAVLLPEALGDAAPRTASIRTHAAEPDGLPLPPGWLVDFIDGRPTEAWYHALEAAT